MFLGLMDRLAPNCLEEGEWWQEFLVLSLQFDLHVDNKDELKPRVKLELCGIKDSILAYRAMNAAGSTPLTIHHARALIAERIIPRIDALRGLASSQRAS